jgi:hypothetical protein
MEKDMFRAEIVFDANKFTIDGTYMISFSMDSVSTDEINRIFREYRNNAICAGMHDNASCLPENRIYNRGLSSKEEQYDEDWYDVEAILVGIHPKELQFMVPYFAEIDSNDGWCRMPIMKIPIEAFMDNELREAPVHIHRMCSPIPIVGRL